MAKKKTTRVTVRNLVDKGVEISYQDEAALDREIQFVGIGWYSLNDLNVYHRNMKATYSRIYVGGKKNCVD